MCAAYGVTYPPGLLDSLSQSSPNVRLLPTKDFEQLHLAHILAHPQDHALFPFLHGLEGNNEAQNSFFATAPNAHETHLYTNTQHPRVKVPKYRGLVCVVCEEDLESSGDLVSLRILRRKNVQMGASAVSSPSSSMYSSSSESYDDDDDDDEYDIQERYSQNDGSNIRVGVAGSDDTGMHLPHAHSLSMSTFHEKTKGDTLLTDPNSQSHMHPVSHRPDPKVENNFIAVPSPTNVTDPASPPLLTGTFRPKELLQRVKTQDGTFEWEFIPAKVPDGISLRNFGIQVPIYATLSDIVVYSPKGASPATLLLAQRFAQAIELKRQERLCSLGFSVLPDEEEIHGLLKYNVFVLDATEERMRKDLSHLMMRVCVEPVTGGLFGRGCTGHGSHTDGPDGHVVELAAAQTQQMVTATEDVIGSMDMEVDSPELPERVDVAPALVYNTIDFAQREKEEMRDLTKASEIISLFPTSLTKSALGSPGWSAHDEGSPQQRHRSHSSASSHHPYRSTRPPHLQFLPQVQPPTSSHQTFSFSPPSTASIDISSTMSYFESTVGQVFLGNSGDVPLAPDVSQSSATEDNPFDYEATNSPQNGLGYDICIECHDLATFPSAAHLRAAEEHLGMLDLMWAERHERQMQERFDNGEEIVEGDIPLRPPPHANAVIHLTLPSSPTNTQVTMSSLMPTLRFIEKWLRPVTAPTFTITRPEPIPPSAPQTPPSSHSSARRWSSVASFMPSFVPFASSSSSPKQSTVPLPTTSRNRSLTSPSPAPIPSVLKPKPRPRPTRPLKILIYSSDGYTESSVPALCLLMAIKGLSLPEAYLELQVAKRRSFFVYNNDLGILRRVEARLKEERGRSGSPTSGLNQSPTARGWTGTGSLRGVGGIGTRPPAKSVSFTTPPPISGTIKLPAVIVPPQPLGSHLTPQQQAEIQQHALQEDVGMVVVQDSSTKEERFDGSFPSRVLPFLYLGNLNHATNAYMLHALGITHVVSVGECALVPPPSGTSVPSAGGGGMMGLCDRPGPSAQFVAGKGPGIHGSLWIEEREGRIKVLDIKGVCDDGIDTLEPQLEPICDWIDKARQDGGQVLVHCRIAYVMKHLNLPLVDAYLIVRSRRLSVLIQPNMRLLYNLCGWEIKLAKERAKGDERKLKQELSRSLSWPSLAKEVHALNEKYLH
ncbi:Dual specificity protein phosphatase PPS1 [Leucoagaricus sp. SymC.cos]|nr:Dual specificity protein phosphatase PPS1 [Leucoagaricus sp. SymC.cos]